jgi:hypothetical protein
VIFAPNSNGDVSPLAVIKGSHTGLYNQGDITIGPGGKIYVVNGQFATAVSVFPAGANGDVSPWRHLVAVRRVWAQLME